MKKNLRSSLLLRFVTTAVVLAPLVSFSSGQTPPAAPTPAAPAGPDFRFALTGDSIINRRISVFSAPGFTEFVERIRSADAAFTNFETLIHHFEFPGEALSGGTYMGSPPYVTDELKWLGIDLLGTANNHTFDFGIEGMRSNLKYLRESGLAFAGTGENLARARAPAYLDTPKGRVALISCSSTFPPASAAGPQRSDMPGRPGLNPLRFTTTYTVDTATYNTISALAGLSRRAATGEGGRAGRGGATAGGSAATDPAVADAPIARATTFLTTRFEEGAANAVHTKPVPADLDAIIATVRDARQQADWVLVSIHCHEAGPGGSEVPAEFLVTFAHAMIDAGADLMVGHGPHLIRPIEIYKRKPIFYSVGNFIFENDLVQFQPQENYDSNGLPPTALPSEFYSKRSRNDTISFPANQSFWESMMAEPIFDAARNIKSIRVYPLELGFKQPRPDRGRPYPASETVGRSIVERLNKMSESYGTNVTYEKGVGVVSWKN